MPASDYASSGSGVLKLKGSAGVDKKHKKKKKKQLPKVDEVGGMIGEVESATGGGGGAGVVAAASSSETKPSTATLQSALADEDEGGHEHEQSDKDKDKDNDGDESGVGNGTPASASASAAVSRSTPTSTPTPTPGKTEAQLRYEERRRKRLEERLRREGVRTHKERVEELNRYLSNLSEHHDMYGSPFPPFYLFLPFILFGFWVGCPFFFISGWNADFTLFLPR